MNVVYKPFWKHLLNALRSPLIWKLSIYLQVNLLHFAVTIKKLASIFNKYIIEKRARKKHSLLVSFLYYNLLIHKKVSFIQMIIYLF